MFAQPLLRGTLVRRYKRFLADVVLATGETVVAHCANSGSMLSVCEPGSEVWLSKSDNPKRTLAFTWELIRVGDSLVGINTGHPNTLVAEGIANGTIGELAGYRTIRREVRYGRNSRIDLLLEAPGRPTCYVEVKNVMLKRGTAASDPVEFPDAVTSRGAKHLDELSRVAASGARAVMLFVAQREDGERMTVAADIDPAYAAALRAAVAAGVEVLAYRCRVGVDEILVASPMALAT